MFVDLGKSGGALGGLMSQMMNMMGGGGDQMQGKMAKTQQVIDEISQQFQDPTLTTFVCVCIPEFLALYETGTFFHSVLLSLWCA